MTYHVPRGGLPPQTALTTDRARFTEAYAVIPARTQSDITASYLPGWDGMRMWVLARPLSGFAETFSWYVAEVSPGGGTDVPRPRASPCCSSSTARSRSRPTARRTSSSPAATPTCRQVVDWALRNTGDATATFHWIRKSYDRVDGLDEPGVLVTHERDVQPVEMPGTDGAWSTTRFVEIDDLRHDMHVNIVNFQPGGAIPFPETHVMEHGLYVLEGKAVYLLNTDWVEVEAGDFMWLRAFCPQACYAGGPGPFRYLLYKDVNRHARPHPRWLRCELASLETSARGSDRSTGSRGSSLALLAPRPARWLATSKPLGVRLSVYDGRWDGRDRRQRRAATAGGCAAAHQRARLPPGVRADRRQGGLRRG